MSVLMPAELLMELHHLVPGIAHQRLNLMTLVGTQAQLVIEPIDESRDGMECRRSRCR